MNFITAGWEYVHLDVAQVAVQVLDDVRLLGAVEERQRAGVALLGPHTGVRRVYGHRSHVAEKVNQERHGCDLDEDLREKKPKQNNEPTGRTHHDNERSRFSSIDRSYG